MRLRRTRGATLPVVHRNEACSLLPRTEEPEGIRLWPVTYTLLREEARVVIPRDDSSSAACGDRALFFLNAQGYHAAIAVDTRRTGNFTAINRDRPTSAVRLLKQTSL